MLVAFANIIDKDTIVYNSYACSQYGDIAGQTDEMHHYIVEACRLGLMGLRQDGTIDTNFRPNDKVKRADFLTTLSRLLYGSTYNVPLDSNIKWYESHVNALKGNQIVTKTDFTSLNSWEVRMYVWIMFERAYRTVK